ncbi:MAG: RagB/SusD family nutrient uptake outer membrane protein [Saprospiraceae bacterium]|nr:RagB/SusD family nutrient uptake outer membrane protein [Saprospiraceae bacterium]
MKKYILKTDINLRALLILVSILVSTSSCEDFLEEKVVSLIGNEYIATAQGFQDASNAMYQGLRKFYGSELGMTMTEMGTDTYTNGADGSYKYYNQYTSQLDPRDNWITVLWTELYKSINTANAVIERGASITGIPAATVTLRVAEAKALRAHYYFVLTQFMGGVDLRLTETVGPETSITRASEEQMYTQIIKDLEEALKDLPSSSAQWGRYTKLAVENLLAKVHLTRAYRPFGSAADFTKAETYGKNVINNYGKKLLPDYGQLWTLGNDEHSEAIFSVQYSYDLLSSGGDGNRFHLYYLMEYDTQPGMSRVLEVGRPWKRLRPTNYTYNEVMVNRSVDSRYDKSFVKVFLATKAGTFNTSLDQSKPKITVKVGDTCIFMPGYEMDAAERATKPYQVFTPSMYQERHFGCLSKFLDPKRASINEEKGGRDFMVSRLADTYLMVAEALIKQNKNSDAVPFINAVRQRAAFPGKQNEMSITAAQVNMNLIYDERARELLGEMHRWFDLKRWGNLIERVKKYNLEGKDGIKDIHTYRPIPQIQIDRVEGGNASFPQNPGY